MFEGPYNFFYTITLLQKIIYWFKIKDRAEGGVLKLKIHDCLEVFEFSQKILLLHFIYRCFHEFEVSHKISLKTQQL